MSVVATRLVFLAFIGLTGFITYNALYLQEQRNGALLSAARPPRVPLPDGPIHTTNPPASAVKPATLTTDLPPLRGQAAPQLVTAIQRELAARGAPRAFLKRLAARGWIEPCALPEPASAPTERRPSPLTLTPDQAAALEAIEAEAHGFAAFVLHGITGSGKTEIFLRLIAAVLDRDRQTLLLVPEIGLTPQLVGRLRERFGDALVVLHSALTPRERAAAWQKAQAGEAMLVVGTRSAVFAPLPRAGLVIVDEEHDASYKQQEGFRYSARDLAVARARGLGVRVVLASATPSLESLHNAASGRYKLLRLPRRIGAAGSASAVTGSGATGLPRDGGPGISARRCASATTWPRARSCATSARPCSRPRRCSAATSSS